MNETLVVLFTKEAKWIFYHTKVSIKLYEIQNLPICFEIESLTFFGRIRYGLKSSF